MSLSFVIPEFNIGGAGTPPLQFFRRGFNLGTSGSQPSWRDVILSGNTALTLVNAKEDGLNYLKLFGGTEQRNLPSEYTQVNYVTNSAQTLIDTGVKFDFSKNYEIELKVRAVLGSWYIFQARDSVTNNITGISGSSTGNTILLGWNGDALASNISRTYGNIYYIKVTINNGTTTLYVKDETANVEDTVNGTYTVSSEVSPNICLFGNTRNDYVSINSDIYYARIKEDGNYIMNYEPCKQSTTAGFYDKASGTFKTTTDLSAGADVVPTPDTPMDIVSNNGVVKVSKNLYDINTRTQGYYIDASGNLAALDASAVSDYIPCNSNSQYVLSGICGHPQSYTCNNKRIHCYDENKNWIAQLISMEINIDTPFTISVTTPSNARYLRVSAFSSDINTQLEQGSTATPYMPYGQIYTDGTQETVTVTGKNLFDYEYFYDNYQTYSPSAVGRCPIKLQPNTTYTVSTNKEVYSTSASMFVVSGNAIDWTPNTSNNGVLVNSPRTVTTDSNGYLCFGLYVTAENAIPESYFINGTVWVQIELGSTATTYEPYFNGGSATAEMLLKVGNYKDVQSILDGGVTRNVGIEVLNGSEDWKATYQGFFDAPLPNHIATAPAYCNYFQSVTTGTVPPAAERANKVWLGSTWVGLGTTTKFSTVNTFKQWLADQYANGTPVIVVYPTSSPTAETVPGQPLSIQAGTNIVEITQASMEDLELEVSYKATV